MSVCVRACVRFRVVHFKGPYAHQADSAIVCVCVCVCAVWPGRAWVCSQRTCVCV